MMNNMSNVQQREVFAQQVGHRFAGITRNLDVIFPKIIMFSDVFRYVPFEICASAGVTVKRITIAFCAAGMSEIVACQLMSMAYLGSIIICSIKR